MTKPCFYAAPLAALLAMGGVAYAGDTGLGVGYRF